MIEALFAILAVLLGGAFFGGKIAKFRKKRRIKNAQIGFADAVKRSEAANRDLETKPQEYANGLAEDIHHRSSGPDDGAARVLQLADEFNDRAARRASGDTDTPEGS